MHDVYWQVNHSRSRRKPLSPQTKERFLKPLTLVALCGVAVLSISRFWSTSNHAADVAIEIATDPTIADIADNVTDIDNEHIGNHVDGTPAQLHSLPQHRQEAEHNVIRGSIRSGESLAAALGRWGVSAQQVHYLAAALRKEVNPRSIRPGDLFSLRPNQATGKIDEFELVRTTHLHEAPIHYRLRRQEQNQRDAFSIIRTQMPVTSNRVGLAGHVSSSLYSSVIQAGGDAGLVDQLATGIFGWQINFYRDVRPGDNFKIITDKRSTNRPCSVTKDSWQLCKSSLGYGLIAAAEYVNQGRTYRGFSYRSQDGKVEGFFDENGGSLEKTFLKSPMRLTRINSRYGRRFHPVQKRYKPHNGVDFGAARGTPFFAVADGKVLRVGFGHRFNGNYVVLQHPGGVQTEYLHASRIAKQITPGARVTQRQVIGRVGATGMATAPHLHFGMKRLGPNGYRYVNPMSQKFPDGKPLPAAYIEEYRQHVQPLLQQLAQMDDHAPEHALPGIQTASFSKTGDMVAGEGLEPPTSGL